MIEQSNEKKNNGNFANTTISTSKICHTFSTMADKLFVTRVGQTVMGLADRLLLTIEETTKWSLPQDNNAVKLVRPLPWILFLILIIWLRVLRFCLSICSIMVGYQKITPQLFIYFIQNQRQKIQNRQQLAAIRNTKKEKLCLRTRLIMILSYIACGSGCITAEPPTTMEMLSTKAHVACNSEEQLSEMETTTNSDNNLTINEMLDKYQHKSTDLEIEDITFNSEDWKKADDICTTSTENSEIENTFNKFNTEFDIIEDDLNFLKNWEQCIHPIEKSVDSVNNNYSHKNGDNTSKSLIAPKFIIDECSNTETLTLANNIEQNCKVDDTKALAFKPNIKAPKTIYDFENTIPMNVPSYLNTITPLTVASNFEYHSSYENVLSNYYDSLHDIILRNVKNNECDSKIIKTATTTTTITTSNTTTIATTVTTHTTTTLENASSTEDLYYSPIGSPYPCFCNTNNSSENSLNEASSTSSRSNGSSLDKEPEQELQESSQINDGQQNKRFSYKRLYNFNTSKHQTHNKNRCKHHHHHH